MTTLTSTGAVNLTSSTNWSPAQTPVAGDDLVIGTHTLTLDADMTLNTITLNNASSRFAFSGSTRSVGATNGITVSGSVNAALCATSIGSGVSLTITGAWNFSAAQGASFSLVSLTGGTLTLQTVSASQSAALFSGYGVRLCAGGSTGTLNTTGRITQSAAGSTTSAIVSLTSGGWTHSSSGANNLLNSTHGLYAMSGTATFSWTGNFTSDTVPSLTGVVTYAGTGNLTWSGDISITNATSTAGSISGMFVATAAYSGTTSFTGSFNATARCLIFYSTVAHTINWKNQSVTIGSTEFVGVYLTAGTLDISGLVVTTGGKFVIECLGAATVTASSGTSITCTSTSATACAWGTTALDGKIVVLESSPATLPTVAQVQSGVSYGYSGSLLTGTGLIMDPATLATAMITSFSSLPEVMTKTTIATLSTQTSFTLTAGSSDDDVYNGLTAVITNQSTSVQKAVATISDYVGSTKTVTLSAAPGFTIATGDSISIIAGSSSGGGRSFPSEAPANWLKAAGIQDGAFTAAKFADGSLNSKGDWLTTLGTNAPAGWLNAAAFASGSLNGKGDWSTADALSTASSTLQSMITALNNLSAKANWFGSLLLEVPDSGTRAYQFELVVRDDEDKLTNLDGNPTIALTNTAGTDRSSLITTPIANPSTGRYTLTISVGTSTVNEALKLTATGTISGETRYAVITPQVVDYDTATLINSIYTRIGAPAGASIAADIAATKTVVDTVAADTTTLKSRITANLFSGITYFKNWMAVLMGKTADTTTRAEINATTAGAGYNETTDSLEAIRERGDAAWTTGGGGGGGDATAANQTIIINHLTDIKGAGWSSTTDTLEKIRDAISAALDSVIASVGVTPGALTGWPETMAIGDSYTDDCSRSIHLLVRDANDDPITSIGSHAFTDADFTATVVLSQGAQRGRVIGTATWVVGPEGYLNVQIPSKESRRAAEGTATVQVLLKWTNSGDQYTLPATTTRWVAQL